MLGDRSITAVDHPGSEAQEENLEHSSRHHSHASTVVELFSPDQSKRNFFRPKAEGDVVRMFCGVSVSPSRRAWPRASMGMKPIGRNAWGN